MHQVAAGQTNKGDFAVSGCIHNACRAGAQPQPVDHVFEFFDDRARVKSGVVDGRHHQIAGIDQAGQTNVFLAGTKHHFVHTAGAGFTRFAEADLHAGQSLQFDSDMFNDVGRPGAVTQAPDESADFTDAAMVLLQTRQPFDKAINKTGNGVGWEFF